MKEKDYELAVELGESEQIPQEFKFEAHDKLALHKKFVDGGAAAFHDFTSLLNATQDHTLSGLLGVYLDLAKVSVELKKVNIERALAIAISIDDMEGRSQALRRIAMYMNSEKMPIQKVIDVINIIPNEQYRKEELRKLWNARIISNSYDAAEVVFSRFSAQDKSTFQKQFNFIKQYNHSLLGAEKASTILDARDERQLTLAIIAGATGDFEKMVNYARSVPPQIYDGIQLTYSMILAYTGQVDNALILLGGIKTSKTYWIGLGFLQSNTLYHKESTQAIDKLLAEEPLIQESLILLITRFYELFFSNQIQKALTLINGVSDSTLKAQLLEHLVPVFYDIQIVVRE